MFEAVFAGRRALLVSIAAGWFVACNLNPQPEPPGEAANGPGAFPGNPGTGSQDPTDSNTGGTSGPSSGTGGAAGGMGAGGSPIVGPPNEGMGGGLSDAGASDSGVSAGGTSSTDSDAGASPDIDAGDAGSCTTTESSTLDGVTIRFPEQPCVFTLAEAAAGITVDYEVVVTSPTTGVLSGPMDSGGCGGPRPAGLYVREQLAGGSESYCVCDVGHCLPVLVAPQTLVVGVYSGSFEWDGKNWFGPSDTSNPKGDPFPPGSYTLTVRSTGSVAEGVVNTPYEVVGTFSIVLVP